MLPQKLRLGLAIFLIATLTSYSLPALQAEPVPGECAQILKAPISGAETIIELGPNLGYAAELNLMSTIELSRLLLNNPTFHLDMCGYGFYAETMIVPQANPLPIENYYLPGSIPTQTTIKTNTGKTDYKSVFNLNSNPGSKKIIYLDFDGEKIENTSWNKNFYSGITWFASGFSQDLDFGSFSESELDVIQSVWQRVAEDFSAFDVNVTTQLPSSGALERTSVSDQTYGTRALISNDTVIFNSCKCSGLAYVGGFDSITNLHETNQPAWIFTQGVGDNPKFIAEAVTHEVGHTLGLSHDGSKSIPYFPGINGWAPIMGVGFYQPITQWSKGEYVDATNIEDDLSIIMSHGLSIRVDEDENNEKSARNIVENISIGGVIAINLDKDFFKFTPSLTETYSIVANTATLSPDLDINLSIYPVGKENQKVVINPPLAIISTDIIEGVSATTTMNLTKATTYIITIDGAQISNQSNSPYTAYGSIGTYMLTITKGKSQTSPTSGGTSGVVTGNSLPDKLVLPQRPTKGPEPLELPISVKVRWSTGTRFQVIV